jgi:hypothetical protein
MCRWLVYTIKLSQNATQPNGSCQFVFRQPVLTSYVTEEVLKKRSKFRIRVKSSDPRVTTLIFQDIRKEQNKRTYLVSNIAKTPRGDKTSME